MNKNKINYSEICPSLFQGLISIFYLQLNTNNSNEDFKDLESYIKNNLKYFLEDDFLNYIKLELAKNSKDQELKIIFFRKILLIMDNLKKIKKIEILLEVTKNKISEILSLGIDFKNTDIYIDKYNKIIKKLIKIGILKEVVSNIRLTGEVSSIKGEINLLGYNIKNIDELLGFGKSGSTTFLINTKANKKIILKPSNNLQFYEYELDNINIVNENELRISDKSDEVNLKEKKLKEKKISKVKAKTKKIETNKNAVTYSRIQKGVIEGKINIKI